MPKEMPPPHTQKGKKPRPKRMADVAKLAGVSTMTVSRVLTGRGLVHDETRRKVEKAAALLCYVPNQEARTLVGARPARICFIYDDASAMHFSDLALGLLRQSKLSNIQLTCLHWRAGINDLHIQHLIKTGIEGAVLSPSLCEDPFLIQCFSNAGIPIVGIGCGVPDARVSAIYIDHLEAALHMTRHLIRLGHRRIAFLTGPLNISANVCLLEGFQSALNEIGIGLSSDLVVTAPMNYRSGQLATEKLLKLPDRPTAIFAADDLLAAAAVNTAQRYRLDVPMDLTVTGFGDTTLATTMWPELTTVKQPVERMAREALQIITRNIRMLRQSPHRNLERLRLDFEIVRRHSDTVPLRQAPPVEPLR